MWLKSANVWLFLFVDGVLHLSQRFSCTNSITNAIYINNKDSILRSVSLLSPCYPADYNRSCEYTPHCYVILPNVPRNMWIGAFASHKFSVPASDYVDIFLKNGSHTRYSLSNLSAGLFHHEYSSTERQFRVLLNRSPSREHQAAEINFKIDIKCKYK